MPESEYEFSQRVVSLGGGTGHFTWLRGAVKSNSPELITAIAATWDSGGSSGRLRVEQGVLPPGDYMQCLVALMEDENQVIEAFRILKDRSTGDPLVNLLASKAEKAHHGAEGGIDGLRNLFRVRGKIIPVSLEDLDLCVKTTLGRVIEMEHNIDNLKEDPLFSQTEEISQEYFDTWGEANPKAVEAIKAADKIIFPPGSPYTSIYPHLKVRGIPEAILTSRAKVVAIPNLMTTAGEDHHLKTVSFWLRGMKERLGKRKIDYVVVNENHIDPETLERYARERQIPTVFDCDECKNLLPDCEFILAPLAHDDSYSHLLRHNPEKLAEVVLSL